MKSIIPRDELFFDKFDRIASLMVSAAEVLKSILDGNESSGGGPEMLARQIKTFEHEADEAVHVTMDHLHRTFVTPLDRGDIHRLAQQLDNVIDLIDAAASRIDLYKPKTILAEARQLGVVLLQSVKVTQEMVLALRNMKKQSDHILELTVEVDRLENEADLVRRTAMARLFHEEGDVFELIKWKEILQHLEEATDRCEDVSDILEGIVLENA
jgi:predicted phosphate transport protein (TIGR00153 family)